jgi:pimeloyl-ACP methyl ester carboxylesterase
MESSYLYLNGLRQHYLYWSLAESSRSMVLLHGLASNARIWELLAPQLVDLGFAPFAPDLRGHGLTDKPDDGYDFPAFRADLLAFLDAMQVEQPILVGHSWGALLAVDYAAQFSIGPRAPGGIILVDGGLAQLDQASGSTWEQVRARLAPPRLEGASVEDFVNRLSEWMHDWTPDERAIQIILANFEIDEEETIRPRLTYERHMQILRAIWEFRTFDRLARVHCPVLAVMAIPPEPHVPEEAEFLEHKRRGADHAQELLLDLEILWLPDTLHDIPLHKPAELARLIGDFIEAH